MTEEEKEKLALKLWRRLFDFTDSPYTEDDYGRVWCFFCINEHYEGHAKDCIWVEALESLKGV